MTRREKEHQRKLEREIEHLQMQVGVQKRYVTDRDTLALDVAARHAQELSSHLAHISVLQGDRDRLTAALESCTRRLASPAAERDPSRAGWRGLTPNPSASDR